MARFDIHYYQVTQFDKMRCWYIMDNKNILVSILTLLRMKSIKDSNFSVLKDYTKMLRGIKTFMS